MSKIQPHYPQVQFIIKDGNLTQIEAKNYPGTGKQCQGAKASQDIEAALAQKGLIKPIEESDRTFKSSEGIQTNRNVINHKQQLDQY